MLWPRRIKVRAAFLRMAEAGDSGTFIAKEGLDLLRQASMSSLAMGASFRLKKKKSKQTIGLARSPRPAPPAPTRLAEQVQETFTKQASANPHLYGVSAEVPRENVVVIP